MSGFQFGNVVVVPAGQIGVIVKSWEAVSGMRSYDVYVRNRNSVATYMAKDIQHFVYSKELTDEEKEFYAT
jgi:hypothetical protein